LQFLRFFGNHKQGSNGYSPGGVSSEPLVGAISALLQEIREHHEICKKRDEATQAMMNQAIELLGIAVRQITELSKTMAERDDDASARKAAKNVNKTKKAGDYYFASLSRPCSCRSMKILIISSIFYLCSSLRKG
jgi:hypothetical protein